VSDALVSKRILTIPNLVSFARLLAIPVFWWALLVEDNVELAAWLILIIGSTDWVDGYLARRLNQVSELGKVLDPIADRLMIASALIGGLIAGVLPPWFVWALIAREVLVGGMALYLAAKGAEPIDVRWLGKAATFALYGAVPAIYLGTAGVLEWLAWPAAWILGINGLVLYWFTAFLYVGDSRARLAALKSPPDREEV
jgi:cardiolipin synthase